MTTVGKNAIVQDVEQFEGGERSDMEEETEVSDEGATRIDLKGLANNTHPVLAKGSFSIYNSPCVRPATVPEQFREHQARLSDTWWKTILLPAIDQLAPTTLTRSANTTKTYLTTDTKPEYARRYKEDIVELDGLLSDATSRSALHEHFR